MEIIDFISTVPATNYAIGRRSRISQISEHHVVGDAKHAVNKAQVYGQEFSCTYTISTEGKIYNLVSESNTPYTDNDFASNSRSITIEHAGGGDFPYTEAMYRASIELHAYLFKKYGNLNCVRHRDIPEIKADPSKATACPGQLDVERIVREAKNVLGGNTVYISEEELEAMRKDKQSWMDQALEADKYKQAVLKSSLWQEAGADVDNITPVADDRVQFKKDVLQQIKREADAVTKYNEIEKIVKGS